MNLNIKAIVTSLTIIFVFVGCVFVMPYFASPGLYCLVPKPTKHTKWLEKLSKKNLEPGVQVSLRTDVIIVCDEKFKDFTSSRPTRNCYFDGDKSSAWRGDGILNCKAVCPDLYSTEEVKTSCIFRNRKRPNCTDALDGTVAEVSCKPNYQNLHEWESRVSYRTCSNGEWDNNVLPTCIKMCGRKSPIYQPLIVNGATVNKTEYPWHVGLYDSRKQIICGGSLISEQLIVTAAHCVTDPENGKVRDKDNYEVGAGKYYSKYDEARDENAQFSKVEKILVPQQYAGSDKNYIADIAVLVTTIKIKFINGLMPVCLNFYESDDELLEQFSLADNTGYVPGWGKTETANVSDVLKEIVVPIVKQDECAKYLPTKFTEFYSVDKFCAGYFNHSISLCVGDSGGGLVIKNSLDNNYYLTGVVSVSPKDVRSHLICDIQQYTLYTKISDHSNFIFGAIGNYSHVDKKEGTSTNGMTAIKVCEKYKKPKNTLRRGPENTHPKSQPFQALIGFENATTMSIDWTCGGALITEQFVLTSAYCLSTEKKSFTRVALGEFSPNVEPINFSAGKIFTPPGYASPRIYNDVGLIKLDRKVEINDYIAPACLHTDKSLNLETFRSGKNTQIADINIAAFPSKQETKLTIKDSPRCETYFQTAPNNILPDGFVDSALICAQAGEDFTESKCKEFLKGVPLSFVAASGSDFGNEFYSVAGVVSYSAECDKFKNSFIFTRVATYVPWIEKVLAEEFDN